MDRLPVSRKPAWVLPGRLGLRFRSILVKTHIITGPQPVADSVPGQGGAVLAPGVIVQHRGEAGDHQHHQQHRGQHGGASQLGFS